MPSGAGLPLAELCGREAGLPREGFSAPCEGVLGDPSPAEAGLSVRTFLGVEGVY